MLKFIYSEKVTQFCEISTLDLSYVQTIKSTVEILQNFVAFSEYMNFSQPMLYRKWLQNWFNWRWCNSIIKWTNFRLALQNLSKTIFFHMEMYFAPCVQISWTLVCTYVCVGGFGIFGSSSVVLKLAQPCSRGGGWVLIE